MPDLVTIGETMAVFIPDAGLPIRDASCFRMRIAGAESNTAIGVARLGHSAGWISRVGNDGFGEYILKTIENEGVDTSRTKVDNNHSTGIMFKQTINHNSTEVYYYRDNSAAVHLSPSEMDTNYIKSAKILHLTGITPVLSRNCEEYIYKAIALAHENNILISFDPNIRLKLWKGQDYRHLLKKILSDSDIVLLGLSEASMLFDTNNIDQIISTIFSYPKIKYLAIKDGSSGAWVCTREEHYFIQPFPCNSVDTVGAGDGFNAGFIHGILEGKDIKTCGIYGGIVGALATETYCDIDGYPTIAKLNDLASKYMKEG